MITPPQSVPKEMGQPHSEDGLAIISDFNRLASMHAEIGELAEAYAPTPFFLTGLLKAYFKPAGKGLFPFAITMKDKGRLVGIAAFRAKDQHLLSRPRLVKYRTVEFLLPDVVTPDFLVLPDYRQRFVEGALSTLFGTVGCQTALLTLPTGSPNAPIMKSWCLRRGMGVWSSRTSSHAVVKAGGPWSSYQASLNRQFIRGAMKSKRRLEREGRLTISKGVVDNQGVIDKILEVDRHSWKEEWRKGEGRNEEGTTEEGRDEMLEAFLYYYRNSSGFRFLPRFWLMELDGKPISFSVITVMGRVAYLGKTSYDLRYAHYSPGTVTLACMFQDLIESGEVSSMDFFTMQDYQRHWQPEELTRDAFFIEGRKGAIGRLVKVARGRLGRMMLSKLRQKPRREAAQEG